MSPSWCLGKEDSWKALVGNWKGKNEEFMAKSILNKINRGNEGTHNQGNRIFATYMDKKIAANPNEEWSEVKVWKSSKEKKVVKQEPLDERAMMLAGGGKGHGRYTILDTVVECTSNLTRIKATTSGPHPLPPRPWRGGSTRFSDDAFQQAYKELHAAHMDELNEYEARLRAYDDQVLDNQQALFEALQNGTKPVFVRPPPKPVAPRPPTTEEILAHAAAMTPGSAHSNNAFFSGRPSASPHESPMITPTGTGGPQPGTSAEQPCPPRGSFYGESRETRRNSPIP